MEDTEGSNDTDVLAARNFYQKTYCKTTTPGSIIGNQLERSLGIDAERLGFVDNMNKIIGALINAIANKATDATFNKLNDVFGKDE
jgi:plasmid maintenance system antidote protein VapI